ncbi:hypothetical protein Bca4012_063448 [Brassica carinata]
MCLRSSVIPLITNCTAHDDLCTSVSSGHEWPSVVVIMLTDVFWLRTRRSRIFFFLICFLYLSLSSVPQSLSSAPPSSSVASAVATHGSLNSPMKMIYGSGDARKDVTAAGLGWNKRDCFRDTWIQQAMVSSWAGLKKMLRSWLTTW